MMLFVVLSMPSCVKNDLPYPYIKLNITNVEGEGFTVKSINNDTQTVTLSLDEATDIRNVSITNIEYTDGATLSKEVVGVHNLRTELYTTLSLYQNYEWKIVAEQSIERYFTVTAQIGAERIDYSLLRVDIDVNENSIDTAEMVLTVESMKLGAADITTYSPTLEELSGTSFKSRRTVRATAHGVSEEWYIYVNAIEAAVDLTADVWANVAWLNASGDTSSAEVCGFRYRKAGDTNWIDVEATIGNGTFSAEIDVIEELTTYEFMAYCDDTESQIITETSEEAVQMPNSDFELWEQRSSAWYPNVLSTGVDFWGTGNPGSAIAGENVTVYDESEVAPGSAGVRSTKMSSTNVIIAFAAGNIFTGRYVGSNGLNGTLAFGRSFTSRPRSIKGWVKYNQGVVNYTKAPFGEYKLEKGDLDQGFIYIALGDWDPEVYGYDNDGSLLGDDDSPLVVDTRSESTFFDKDASAVIAYGERVLTESEEWHEFEIELDYKALYDASGNLVSRSTERRPTNIVVVFSASRYGDYFTGSDESVMWIDDLELVY